MAGLAVTKEVYTRMASDTLGKMLIIGAGPVGLGMAKGLKQAGIPYDQVDADNDLGGNWYHGVYETTHIISSRKTTEFTDYPMPEDYPDFPSRDDMYRYMQAYADHYGLRPTIEFQKKVVYVRPCEEDRWEVTFADGEQSIYKGVLVCNGHHWDRRWPDYPGAFAGEYLHSKDYKHPDQLKGKRVLVIGGGNSACDIAAEASRVGSFAALSLRRGYWFMPKTILGRPAVEMISPYMPVFAQRLLIKTMLRIIIGRYKDYGLPEPDHNIFEHHPTVSTEVLHYIKHGRLKPRPDIARYEGGVVEFVDGTREAFDMVVAATGFHVSYPFLAPGLVEVKGAVPQVYGGSLVPNYKHLYIIGGLQVRYGIGPLIAPASDLMAMIITLQDECTQPVGAILRDLGDKPPETHLVDPHAAIRRMRWAKKALPWLIRRRDRKMARRQPAHQNPPMPAPKELKPDMQVY